MLLTTTLALLVVGLVTTAVRARRPPLEPALLSVGCRRCATDVPVRMGRVVRCPRCGWGQR